MAVIRETVSRKIFNGANYIFITLFTVFCIIPFILVFMISITDENTILQYGYKMIPDKISFDAYKYLFKDGTRLISSYKVSIIVTLVGGSLSLFITSMLAYVLSNKKLKYRNVLSFYMFFTMVFNGGLIPWYIVCINLGIRNTIWALILPMLVNAWNTFLLRNFFSGIPDSIAESARIDGANEFLIFIKLMLPLAIPGVATIGLFYVLAYWNDWWHAVMFIDKPDIFPLQYLLRQIMSDITMSLPASMSAMKSQIKIPTEGVRMATMMLTIGPIILAYPFAQKYFVKGITIGAVKG